MTEIFHVRPSGPLVARTTTRKWRALTVELKDLGSPVRRFVQERFGQWKEMQSRYRESVGPLVVPGSGDSASILGGAFDWMVRFMVHPYPDLTLALRGAIPHPLRHAAQEMALLLGYRHADRPQRMGISRFIGPVPGSQIDPELLARACWALALLTDVFRAGPMSTSPLWTLDRRSTDAGQLLALAPPTAVDNLLALRAEAQQALLPPLTTRQGPWALGPVFVGSVYLNGDGDLIAAGLLLDVKTVLGTKRTDGTRHATLDSSTIMQLIGYVLLDLPNEFAIDTVGIYSARYAHLATWPLPDLLSELAGRPVDLRAERDAFQQLLLSGAK